MRERDPRNGMKELRSGRIFSKIPYLPQILSRSGWSASFVLDGGVPKLENNVVPGQGPMPLIDVTASLGKSAVDRLALDPGKLERARSLLRVC
jgi:hypothetical protein